MSREKSVSNKCPTNPLSPTNGRIAVRPLAPDDWPVIEKLFGDNGACGGCWCMTWRVPRGGKLWEQNKGEPNRRAFRKLIREGKIFGCLAFCAEVPIGWCCVGPRADFPRLQSIKALQTEWDSDTWSVTCFYIKSAWRGRGVAGKLLKAAVRLSKAHGARRLEGYPVKTYGAGKIPAAFAWTGIPRLFECQKFVAISPPNASRDVYARDFRKSSVAPARAGD